MTEGLPKMRTFVKVTLRIALIVILVPLIVVGVLVAVWATRLERAERYLPTEATLRVRVPSLGRLATDWLHLEAADLVFSTQGMGDLRALVRDLRRSLLVDNPLIRQILEVPLLFALTPRGFLISFDLGWRSLPLLPISFFTVPLPFEDLSLIQTGGLSYYRFRTGESFYFLVLRNNIVVLSDSEPLLREVLAQEPTPSPGEPSRAVRSFHQGSSALQILADTPVLVRDLRQDNPDVSRLLENFLLPAETLLALTLTNQELDLRLETTVRPGRDAAQAILEHRPEASYQIRLVPAEATAWSLLNVADLETLVSFLVSQDPSLQQPLATARDTSRQLLGRTPEELFFRWNTGEIGVFTLPQSPDPVILVRIADRRGFDRALETLEGGLFLSRSAQFLVDNIPLNRLRLPPFLDLVAKLFGIDLELPFYTIHEEYLFLSPDAGNLVRSVTAARERRTLQTSEEISRLTMAIDPRARLLVYYNTSHDVPFFMRDRSLLSRVLRLYQRGVATVSLQGEDLDVHISALRPAAIDPQPLPGFPRPLQGALSSPLRVVTDQRGVASFVYLADGNRIVWDGILVETVRSIPFPNARALLSTTDRASGRDVLWGIDKGGAVWRWWADGELSPAFPVRLPGAPLTDPILIESSLLCLTEPATTFHLVGPDGRSLLWPTAISDPVWDPPSLRGSVLAVYPRQFHGDLYVIDTRGTPSSVNPLPTEGLGVGVPVWARRQGRLDLYFLTTDGTLSVWRQGASALEPLLSLSAAYQAPPVVVSDRSGEEALALVSTSGLVSLISTSGEILREVQLDLGPEARARSLDVDGDRRDELVLYGFGAGILILDRDLRPLTRDPLTGYHEPVFFDLDGNRRLDLFSVGLDQQIYGWSLPRFEGR